MAFYIERFKGIETREFEVEVLTPAFLAGANTSTAELRAPTLKAMLRFWWRATCGIVNQDEMISKESELFGNTKTKASLTLNMLPREPFSIAMDMKQRGKTFKVHGRDLHIVDYLAYGTHQYQRGNVYHKEHIEPGSKLLLKIRFLPKHEGDVYRALSWFIHFGGLGARNRNGFGSLHTKIDEPKIQCTNPLKNYSAISTESKRFDFQPRKTWHEALSDAGLAYRDARLNVERLHTYAMRKLVAAPLTVNRRNMADMERHAKPYYLSVMKLDNTMFQGRILFMPYRYLSGHNNYSDQKFLDYKKACNKINEILQMKSGGPK